MRMHPDQVDTDTRLVRQLLSSQFPHWASLPISAVESYGTDHDLYRLGDQLVARLPRIGWAADQAEKEAAWLPRLAPRLPLAVPVQRGIGRPGVGYPFTWSICEWLPGEDAHGDLDLGQAALDLARFIHALREIDTTGAPVRPPSRRGAPLIENDQAVRRAVHELGDRVDSAKTLRSWEESLAAPVWESPETWIHGDLLPGNLLVVDRRLSAVIDFGGLNVGDPACDLQPAWALFTGESRERFLAALHVDHASRLRGRGWSLLQAVMALPYYWDTNPGMVRQASRSLAEVLADSL